MHLFRNYSKYCSSPETPGSCSLAVSSLDSPQRWSTRADTNAWSLEDSLQGRRSALKITRLFRLDQSLEFLSVKTKLNNHAIHVSIMIICNFQLLREFPFIYHFWTNWCWLRVIKWSCRLTRQTCSPKSDLDGVLSEQILILTSRN
jgi:hypothetical protein